MTRFCYNKVLFHIFYYHWGTLYPLYMCNMDEKESTFKYVKYILLNPKSHQSNEHIYLEKFLFQEARPVAV